jgi:hypothetical protein
MPSLRERAPGAELRIFQQSGLSKGGTMVNYDPIIVAMISCIQMLDDAESDEVDPSFAVKIQQVMGTYLREIPRTEEPELRRILERIAYERSDGDPVIAEYLRRWASALT